MSLVIKMIVYLGVITCKFLKRRRAFKLLHRTLMQDILNLAKAEWIAYVIHHHQTDDFRRCFEILKCVLCCHSTKLRIYPSVVKFV